MLSLRVPPSLGEELRQRAEAQGQSAAALTQRLVSEGLRQDRHPGIAFRGGPSGRRAALPRGPDVWEVVSVLRRVETTGEAAVAQASEWLGQPVSEVRIALDYYADFPDEIDERLRLHDEEHVRLRDAHARRASLLG